MNLLNFTSKTEGLKQCIILKMSSEAQVILCLKCLKKKKRKSEENKFENDCLNYDERGETASTVQENVEMRKEIT